MEIDLATLLIAVFTAAACAVVGVFLVVRKMSMMTDAISHTVLLGIVLAFMVVKDLSSPLLIAGAAAMGVLTVMAIEAVVKTKRTTEDAATGVVFPLLFSAAIIIISIGFRDVHLDTDAVLMGNIEFSALEQLVIGGRSVGPKALYVSGVMLLINAVFFAVFYKELKLVSFDAALAAVLGISPAIIHYTLMSLVSVTAVAAFDAVGSILVIALMVGPAATAMMLTKNLFKTVLAAVVIGITCSAVGYFIAVYYDIRISGTVAAVILAAFLIVLFARPGKGVVTAVIRRLRLKREFSLLVMLVHISNHQRQPDAEKENAPFKIGEELKWEDRICRKIIYTAENRGYIKNTGRLITLTEQGSKYIAYKTKEYELGT